MVSIYISIVVMLLIAMGFLSFSFNNTSYKFLITIVWFCFISLGLYQFSGDKLALNKWLTHGREHYALLEQFQELGGLDGAIAKVKARLAENPNDRQGQLILAKLLEAKGKSS